MGRRPALRVLILVGALVAAGCSGGSDDAARPRTAPKPGTLAVALEPGTVKVEAVERGATVPPAVLDGVMDAVRGYVETATAGPLRDGRATGLGRVFSPAAVARLAGPDRAVVLDEALPTPTRTPKLDARPVAVSVLVDAGGRPVLATATLSLEVDVVARPGRYDVRRTGELVLAPTAGGWQVTGYDVVVARAGDGLGRARRPPAGGEASR